MTTLRSSFTIFTLHFIPPVSAYFYLVVHFFPSTVNLIKSIPCFKLLRTCEHSGLDLFIRPWKCTFSFKQLYGLDTYIVYDKTELFNQSLSEHITVSILKALKSIQYQWISYYKTIYLLRNHVLPFRHFR